MIPKGRVVYWVNWQRFENSPNKRDGKTKAEEYCLNNMINTNNIQRFDSRTECNRYEFLLEQQRNGEISNLEHHFTYRVQKEFTNSAGHTIPPITYEADFVYKTKDGETIVEDVKGSEFFIDDRFILVKQIFDKVAKESGLYIKIVLFKNSQWKEWCIGEQKKQGKLIKKQREEIKKLRAEAHKKEVEENKIQREKKRFLELKAKVDSCAKMTKAEKTRFEELEKRFSMYADN
jgi:hypothetical protein